MDPLDEAHRRHGAVHHSSLRQGARQVLRLDRAIRIASAGRQCAALADQAVRDLPGRQI